MPTMLYVEEWRLFFYSKGKDAPLYIQCNKPPAEGLFWLDIAHRKVHDIKTQNVSEKDTKFLSDTILLYLEYIQKGEQFCQNFEDGDTDH
ncbi:MAG: hypothetical protein HQM11_12400 [SAR324 cluster bacterium]|nr:hypothetical protein [SAR324 cluster bacterium]